MPEANEQAIRQSQIDPALLKAGWDVRDASMVGLEVPVDGTSPEEWAELKAQLNRLKGQYNIPDRPIPPGICDYVLKGETGEILAVVEAKKASVDPRLAEAQARFYLDHIEARQGWRPFAFLTNGYRIYFMEPGRPRREVNGFFSRDDLKRLLQARREGYPLHSTDINPGIAGRSYQQEAIRSVVEAFEQGRRRALVVMATGTGKTRTAMALIDMFMRANHARNVLFVADRDELVKQAKKEGFQDHLPHEPVTRLVSYNVDTSNRLYVVTLQTLSNLLERFTPGFFDLIIFDEVHRSIFAKYRRVLDYFDGRMIGLTATPAQFIDRNTFLSFECTETPTYLYGYAKAIEDGYLVDYKLYKAKTHFQRNGIKGASLSQEEKDALTEQGIDPDDLDYEGSELEKTVTNRDTLRKQWEEIMNVLWRDKSGTLPGKTILFALSQGHAERLLDVFREMYPQYPELAEVITYKTNYKGTAIDRFKDKSMPRIAISVDMLDTGVNVPEAVNLVVMKPVQSRIKLEQMIGRGTRAQEACEHLDWLPGGVKKGFLIVDFWENDFTNTTEAPDPAELPLLVRLFNTRLKLLAKFLGLPTDPEAQRLIAQLRQALALLPVESFTVRKHLPDIQHALEDGFWSHLTQKKLEFLERQVGPLLRHVNLEDIPAHTFTHKLERLKLGLMDNQRDDRLLESILEDVSRLPDFVRETPEGQAAVEFCLRGNLPTASPQQINHVAEVLAPQMRHRREQAGGGLVALDLKDAMVYRSYIVLDEQEQPVYAEQYRETVEAKVIELANSHPTLQAMAKGQPISDAQLMDLERTVRKLLGESYLRLDERNIHRAYGWKLGSLLEFMRKILELPALIGYDSILTRQFDQFIQSHTFTAQQIHFINAVRNTLKQRKHISSADLYDDPFTLFGQNAVERLFKPDEVQKILTLADQLSLKPEA